MTEPLVDVTGARRRRARARLRRHLSLAGVLVAVFALVGGGLWAVWGSPWLVAREVRVTGTVLLTPDQVGEAAAVPLGRSLASVETGAIEARVVERLPQVASVRVGRAWPAAVTVDVTERVPVMAILLGSEHVWVSGDGVPFHHTAKAPEGVMLAEGNLGDVDVLAALGRVAATLPPEVREQATRIQASSADSVVITLRDRRRVVWGSAEDADLKVRVLLPLLGVRATEYDVSAPSHPTTR